MHAGLNYERVNELAIEFPRYMYTVKILSFSASPRDRDVRHDVHMSTLPELHVRMLDRE